MKVLYISNAYLADCDFPLIKGIQEKGWDITYLIQLSPHSLKSTLFNIAKQFPCNEIIKAELYPEINTYRDYLSLENVYIANCTAIHEYELSYIIMIRKIWKFIKRGNYDIVHSDSFFSLTQIPLYLANKNWILTVHDPFPHSGEQSLYVKIKRWFAMRLVKQFVLLNKSQVNKFCKVNNIKESNVLINQLGVYDIIKKYAYLNIERKNSDKTILYFGRISPYKGIEYLLEAAVAVHKKIPNVKFIIAGSGKYYFDINKYEHCDYIDIKNHFISLEDLGQLILKSDIVVCPYIDATQSGVVMTSFALNTPVVCTNVGGLPEMVEHNKSGIVIPPKNAEKLRDALIYMLTNKDVLNEMASYIDSEFNQFGKKSWYAITEKYINFYNKYRV